MPRVHKDYREGRCSRFTNESKFDSDRSNTRKMAQEAIREGEALRQKLQGHRVLIPNEYETSLDRDLKNAFRS